MARAHEATRDSGNGVPRPDSLQGSVSGTVADSAEARNKNKKLQNAVSALAQRGIAPLIIILFLAVAIATALYIYRVHLNVTRSAEAELSLIADMTRARFIQPDTQQSSRSIRDRLADSRPETIGTMPVRVFLTDAYGLVTGADPALPGLERKPIDQVLRGAPGAFQEGRFAGYLNLYDQADAEHLAVSRRLPAGAGYMIIAVPRDHIREQWHSEARFSASILFSMNLLVLLIGMALHWQANRLRQLNEAKSAERIRLATALSRGRCGLWEWDLQRGELTWSDSMCALIGMPARETQMTLDKLESLTHPDDPSLRDVGEDVVSGQTSWIDHAFRLRHKDGHWVWLRARADITPDTADPERLHLFGIAIDISEKKKFEAISTQAESRLHDAIENISESFVLWDNKDRLVMCNSKFIEQSGLSSNAALLGKKRAEISALSGYPPAFDGFDTEAAAATPYLCHLDDGRWLNISERPTREGGIVSVGTDITALKQHEEQLVDSQQTLMATVEELQASREEMQAQTQKLVELADRFAAEKVRAELASQAKSVFLSNMSHELRTPLNAILGFSEIIAHESFGPLGASEYREYANDIHDSGVQLRDLISDILDMSRIEAGRYELTCEPFNLSQIARESVHIIAQTAKQKNITTRVRIAGKLTLDGDRRAIRQVLANLLSNAVKFTNEDGQINIRARRVGAVVTLSIEDNGIGIPSSEVHRLGRPFELAADHLTKDNQGSGLGLAISRSLTEMHGGSLRIRSREGHGTIVSLRLPVDGAAVPAHAAKTDAT